MSSIEDKLALANANVPKTYMAGKSCKDLTDFSYFFYLGARLEMLEYLNTYSGTNFTSMFDHCEKISTIQQLDTANGTNFEKMFFYCLSLTSIPQLNTSNGMNFKAMFAYCSSLTSIPQLDISKGANIGHSLMFNKCRSLKNISFTGTIGASISFSDSSLLTTDSLHSIVYALADKTGSTTKPTLTLNSASWTALEETTPPTGSSSWHEYITNVKGWTYA